MRREALDQGVFGDVDFDDNRQQCYASSVSMRGRTGRGTSHGPNVPWVLLAALFILFVFVGALLFGEWVSALGVAIFAVGAGSYYLYLVGGRSNRRLWIASNVLLTLGTIVIVLGGILAE